MRAREVLSEIRTGLGACALVVLLACTVGETPPGTPSPGPGDVPAPGAPGGEPGGGDVEESALASELLGRSRLAYEAAQVEEARRLARQVLSDYPGTASAAQARWVAARAAFALGRYSEARELALEFAGGQPSGSSHAAEARSLAELASDALETPAAVTVVGAVLPRSGPRVLVAYADWLLEGIRLAVAEAERTQNRRIELVIADDGGGARLQEAVREVERQGAVAVVGPLLAEQIGAAAGARTNGRLVLVSPTATETPISSESYSLNSSDARGAQELGRYAAEVGLGQAAVLYPRIAEFERKAQAFTVEYEAAGGQVRAFVPYDSGTTTFASHMQQILAAVAPVDYLAGTPFGDTVSASPDSASAVQQPFALFVAAPERDVPQIAPQVSFYGLDSAGVQLFGDEAWASATVRRVVPARDLESVIAASRFPPDRAGAPWDPAFVAAYEERYRKSLDNQLPALGYDAANLIMQALPNRLLNPDALAFRFRLLAGIRGATGMLSVRANRVVRAPYLVIIRNGELAPAPYPWEYELPVPVQAPSLPPSGGAGP